MSLTTTQLQQCMFTHRLCRAAYSRLSRPLPRTGQDGKLRQKGGFEHLLLRLFLPRLFPPATGVLPAVCSQTRIRECRTACSSVASSGLLGQ